MKTRYFRFSYALQSCPINPLCTGGGPEDPQQQIAELFGNLKWLFKSGWNVFDFSFIYLKKISYQKFLKVFLGLSIVHITATVCSSIRTFFRGSKLLTVAVLWTLFGVFKKCSFVTGFPQLRKVSIKLPLFAVLGHNSKKGP